MVYFLFLVAHSYVNVGEIILDYKYMWTADKEMNMEAVFVVMNTT